MADEVNVQIPTVRLGNQGLEVSKLGFGCVGLTGTYNAPLSEEDGISLIKDAFSKGITFFDTADSYGAGANEILVGKAMKQLPRQKIQLATKFGIVKMDKIRMEVKGTPDYVVHAVKLASSVLVGELKRLVEDRKIKYVGLSEASSDTIRRAHAVHPVTAVQMEWSLWTRDIEEEIVPLCRELGIGVVAYSPLGRGFFGGKVVVESIPANTILSAHPRFTGENLGKNKILYRRIENLAAKHGCLPARLALAWLLHQGDNVVPIPGTTQIKNLDDNIGTLRVKLTEADLEEVTQAVPIDEVAGASNPRSIQLHSWKFANTPLKRWK